jgi:hypothetical protein
MVRRQRFVNWAAKIGPDTRALIERILGSRAYPQQAFRSCLGILVYSCQNAAKPTRSGKPRGHL